jgi:hypothetical protein
MIQAAFQLVSRAALLQPAPQVVLLKRMNTTQCAGRDDWRACGPKKTVTRFSQRPFSEPARLGGCRCTQLESAETARPMP